MEVKRILRNLVTKQYMNDLDYAETEFSFKTVFHLDTLFSYCMCTCAFEHEFVDYISETGDVNEEKYEKIVKCIIDGECPHVNQVPEEFVRKTSVYGIHIACAVGTMQAIYDNPESSMRTNGKLFHIVPISLTFLKNHKDDKAIAALLDNCPEIRVRIDLITAVKANDNEASISFKSVDVGDLLARNEDETLFRFPDLTGLISAEPDEGETVDSLLSYNVSFENIQDVGVLKIILDSGINVDNSNSIGLTPFVDLLQHFIIVEKIQDILLFRQSVELYLFENIDVVLHQKALKLAREIDRLLINTDTERLLADPFFHFMGLYHMDVNKHSLFGHDNGHDFALNFMAPLFLESGFPMTDISLDLNNDTDFHPEEVKYLRFFQTMPKSLKVSCRNSLRNHFKGRQIHWFVKQSSIPKSIEDFILLRPLLKAVPKHFLDVNPRDKLGLSIVNI